MLRGLSLRHDGPAVLIVDEASRVRDELWATISPMLAAAPAAQQILLSTPAGAGGEFHRAMNRVAREALIHNCPMILRRMGGAAFMSTDYLLK